MRLKYIVKETKKKIKTAKKKAFKLRHYIVSILVAVVFAFLIVCSLNDDFKFIASKENFKLAGINFCNLMLLTFIGENFKGLLRASHLNTTKRIYKILEKLPFVLIIIVLVCIYMFSLFELNKSQQNDTLTIFITTMGYIVVTGVFSGLQERVEEDEDDEFVEATKKFYFAKLREKQRNARKQHLKNKNHHNHKAKIPKRENTE